MKRLVLLFHDSTTRQEFVGWFLDGGGDQNFAESQSLNGSQVLQPETPDSAENWDWQVLGDDADEFVIDMKPVGDDDAEASEEG